MADPFEVRVRFTQILSTLSASNTAAQKAAQYLLKHKSMSEDLHSCIIEQVEHVSSMNVRANILCFVEIFFDLAAKEQQSNDYLPMLQRDIVAIVKSVTPCNALGHVNIAVAKLVVQNLQRKRRISDAACTELHAWFDTHEAYFAAADPLSLPSPGAAAAAPAATKSIWDSRMFPAHVLQRIEEDRERHKRMRENIWAVPTGPGDRPEWERVWEDTSDLGDDDYGLAREEAEEREGVLADYCEHWREKLEKKPDVVAST